MGFSGDTLALTPALLLNDVPCSTRTPHPLHPHTNRVLYATFASPWADKPTTKDPQYTLPQCYYMQPPALKTGHLSEFKLETLFYIFYAMPRDSLQAYAAQELYKRDWRYHKVTHKARWWWGWPCRYSHVPCLMCAGPPIMVHKASCGEWRWRFSKGWFWYLLHLL